MAGLIAEAETKLRANGAAPASRTVGYKRIEDLTPNAQDEATQRNVILYALVELHKKFDALNITKEKVDQMYEKSKEPMPTITGGNSKELIQKIEKLQNDLEKQAKAAAINHIESKQRIEQLEEILKKQTAPAPQQQVNVSTTDIDKLAEKLGGMAITTKESTLFYTERDY